MDTLQTAIVLGFVTGLIGIVARHRPIAAWLMLSPLAFATYVASPWAAGAAGAVAGATIGASVLWGRGLRSLMLISAAGHAASWGVAFGVAAWLWPNGAVAWCSLALPGATVFAMLPLRWLGAPRWVSNPLACTQEPWLTVVHTARLGGDLVPTAMLGVSGSLPVVLLAEWPLSSETALVAGLAVVVLAAVLSFGAVSLHRAQIRAGASGRRVRVAAVAVDAEGRAGKLERTIERYAPAVQRAVEEGARVIVLPELALRVDADSRERSLVVVCDWAKQGRVVVVAPFFDETECSNGLHIVDASGRVVARYEKQHPSPLEPKRRMRTPPVGAGLGPVDDVTLSAVICVDLDYVDLIPPVNRRGGILLVPAHDWPALEHLHHRTAVWAPVLTGVPLVRATADGTSAIFDAAGRVLAQRSSLDGPVVLCADVQAAAKPPA